MSHQVTAVRTYAAIFAALLALTAITAAVAFLDLGPMNNAVAIGIAVLKATLVVLYFMHAKDSPRMTGVVISAALLWLVILVGLTLADYSGRGWLGIPGP